MSGYRQKAIAHYPHVCDICGADEEPLDAHHRNGNHQDGAIDNLQLLCKPCHTAEHIRTRLRDAYGDNLESVLAERLSL